MIITLVVLGAMLYPEYNIFTHIAEKTPYNICRQSVEARAFPLTRVKNIELMPYLKCETQQYVITEKNVEEARKTIADAMYNCYYQFARGEKDLFDGEGIFCFVCSTIDFEKLKEIPALKKYLFEEYGDAKNTYAQYLYKYKNFAAIKKQIQTKPEYTAPIPAQKTGVLFVYRKFKTAKQVEIEGEFYEFARKIQPYLPSQFAFVGPEIAGETYLFGEYLGQYQYTADVMLINPYIAEKITGAGCTQKIPQATK